jgi:hypothetical protein
MTAIPITKSKQLMHECVLSSMVLLPNNPNIMVAKTTPEKFIPIAIAVPLLDDIPALANIEAE